MNRFEDMDRLFEEMWRSRLGNSRRWMCVNEDVNLTAETNEDGYVVLTDLPGFEMSELEVTYENDLLSIRGTYEVGDDAYAASRYVRGRAPFSAEDNPSTEAEPLGDSISSPSLT